MNDNLINDDSIDENIRNLEENIEKPEMWISDEQIPVDILETGAEVYTYMNFCPPKERL